MKYEPRREKQQETCIEEEKGGAGEGQNKIVTKEGGGGKNTFVRRTDSWNCWDSEGEEDDEEELVEK